MKVEVVIGANYGDEGKGLATEFRCRRNAHPIVVLSNGGCQRGHTVNNIEKGIRHVFHHFGSGTMLGVPSVYAKTFLLNPIKFIEEQRELKSIGISPIAYRAPSCLLQLPVDMFVNQALEKWRSHSNAKHGSCGWGIWETQVRNKSRWPKPPLTFEEFASCRKAAKRTIFIEETERHVEEQLSSRGIPFDHDVLDTILSEEFIKHFIADFEKMEESVELLKDDNLLQNDYGIDIDAFIVENAQGLLLDVQYAPNNEDGSICIYTTPSKCGLDGALEALGSGVGRKDISAFYVSRTYLTRHGNGPFPEEDCSFSIDDKTNLPNEYQGTMRFGKFNLSSLVGLNARMQEDSQGARSSSLVVTHMNELQDDKLVQMADFISCEDDSSKVREA